MENSNQFHGEKEYPAGLATREDLEALVDRVTEKSEFGEIIEARDGRVTVTTELDLIKGRNSFAGALEALDNPQEAFVTIFPSDLMQGKVDCVFELSYLSPKTRSYFSNTIAVKYHSTYFDKEDTNWHDEYMVQRTPGDKADIDIKSRSVAPMLFTAKYAHALCDLLNAAVPVGSVDNE